MVSLLADPWVQSQVMTPLSEPLVPVRGVASRSIDVWSAFAHAYTFADIQDCDGMVATRWYTSPLSTQGVVMGIPEWLWFM